MADLINKQEVLCRLEELKSRVPNTFFNGIDVAKAVIQKIRPEDVSMTIPGNRVNLCDSCMCDYPMCPAEAGDIKFGDGRGNDNICACFYYVPVEKKEKV